MRIGLSAARAVCMAGRRQSAIAAIADEILFVFMFILLFIGDYCS
jgi:hypothetical protein